MLLTLAQADNAIDDTSSMQRKIDVPRAFISRSFFDQSCER
jgi:hypothetical protein